MKRRFAILISTLVVIVLLILVYPIWLSDGAWKPVLEAELNPMAESLIQRPDSLPQFVNSITPPPGSTITSSERVCVGVLPGAFSASGDTSTESLGNVAASTKIIVNNQAIPRDDVSTSMLGIMRQLDDGRLSGQVNVCFEARLRSGIHLVAIEVRNSALGVFGIGEAYSYTWVYRVE